MTSHTFCQCALLVRVSPSPDPAPLTLLLWRIRRNDAIRKLAENVGNMIDRCSKHAHRSFKPGILACSRMASRWYKSLGPAEIILRRAFGRPAILTGAQGLLESRQIIFFLFFDMLRQHFSELFKLWDVLRVCGAHILEFLQHNLDLFPCRQYGPVSML